MSKSTTNSETANTVATATLLTCLGASMNHGKPFVSAFFKLPNAEKVMTLSQKVENDDRFGAAVKLSEKAKTKSDQLANEILQRAQKWNPDAIAAPPTEKPTVQYTCVNNHTFGPQEGGQKNRCPECNKLGKKVQPA